MSAPDFARAVTEAKILARVLPDIADGRSTNYATALVAIDRIVEIRTDLLARYRQHLTEQIADAAGDATTHTWRVDDEATTLECADCGITAQPHIVRAGQTPVCPDLCRGDLPHAIFTKDEDSSCCVYCKTQYPSTAGTREGVPS